MDKPTTGDRLPHRRPRIDYSMTSNSKKITKQFPGLVVISRGPGDNLAAKQDRPRCLLVELSRIESADAWKSEIIHELGSVVNNAPWERLGTRPAMPPTLNDDANFVAQYINGIILISRLATPAENSLNDGEWAWLGVDCLYET